MQFGNTKLEFLENGFIRNICIDEVYLNLFELSNLDIPLLNIYAKINGETSALLTQTAIKKIEKAENCVNYIGTIKDFTYTVSFILAKENQLFVTVKANQKVEFYFSSDIGLSDDPSGAGSTYKSQYIDNKVYDLEDTYTIAMRRTTKTPTGFAFAQFGSFNKVLSYVTEGYDFLGLQYRSENIIQAFNSEHLISRARNYELAFVGFEVEKTNNATFYITLNNNMEHAIGDMIPTKDIEQIFENTKITGTVTQSELAQNFDFKLLNGDDISSEIEQLYPKRLTEQFIDSKLGSFFSQDNCHVVLPIKELNCDRTHGSIITTGNTTSIENTTFVSTNYMNGIFSAQNVVGNTQINKLSNNINSSLYLNKLEGMRIFVKEDGYKLLNIPSLYEMGFNYSKWIYRLKDNEIKVIAYTDISNPQVTICFESTKPVTLIITDNIVGNFKITENIFTPKEGIQVEKCPGLNYKYEVIGGKLNTKENVIDKQVITSEFEQITSGKIIIAGSKDKEAKCNQTTIEASIKDFESFYDQFTKSLKLNIDGTEKANITAMNHMLKWYVHNALIHFATPHGLEQHGGAAWGTRDVCQGPVELFSSFGMFTQVREILVKIFDNQFIEDGNWPQWFMFDEYDSIRPTDAHGDIIVWPLKAISDYLLETGDLSILDEEVGYYKHDATKSEVTETILQHIIKEINYIKSNFLEGTSISSYGEGDWDDTLQPANSMLRTYMASGWTVPLTYQAFSNFAKVIKDLDQDLSRELNNIASEIKVDYKKYIMADGISVGFIYMEQKDKIEHLLHPRDKKTGINYRLLPINRSIISGIYDEKNIETHLDIIDKHLICPDGVRLMNAPAAYNGGVSEIFQRAESASTVGREISLQYIHAHIRYLEAMAKIGQADRLYQGIKMILPFNINDNVKNANIRQSNAYFSSSEGDFNNRYDYKENFNKLRDGSIKVKSGWRIYSSGPGIFLKQFISNFLGLKYINGELHLDPVVGSSLDGLELSTMINNQLVTIVYKKDQKEITYNGQSVTPNYVVDTYKQTCFKVDMDLIKEETQIIVPIQ